MFCTTYENPSSGHTQQNEKQHSTEDRSVYVKDNLQKAVQN